MALDETLLVAHEKGLSPPTLRFYSWYPYAVSTGYSQRSVRCEVDIEGIRNLKIPIVRRPTGGGILFHYKDISYAVIFNRDDKRFSNAINSYRLIHEAFINSLSNIGLSAYLQRQKKVYKNNNLCFMNLNRMEVLIDGKKVIGSAQRRLKNSFLQHGSLFLEPPPSRYLRLFRGLNSGDIFRSVFWLQEHIDSHQIKDVINNFIISLGRLLDVNFITSGTTNFEKEYMNRLLIEKHNKEVAEI